MYPIKFRGKCFETGKPVTGKLVTGSYVELAGYALIISKSTWEEYNENRDGCSEIMEVIEYGTKYQIACKVYPVDKSSIAQFIGYDKYKNEVYFDDILIDFNGDFVPATNALEKWDIGDVFEDYILVKEV